MPIAPAVKKAPQAAKAKGDPQNFPIYFTIVSDGPVPGKHNLLHVTARFGPTLVFQRNIIPQNGVIRAEANLPEPILKEIGVGRVTVAQAMRDLSEWLGRFNGNRFAVTSAMAFWHIVHHLNAVIPGKLPIATNPIDVSSFQQGAAGELKSPPRGPRKSPGTLAEERQTTVEKLLGKRSQSRSGEFVLEWDREYEV